MAVVTVNQGESIESALRRFKRKVMTEEIIKDAKKHAFFMPPGQKAKLKSALARKRNKKKGNQRGGEVEGAAREGDGATTSEKKPADRENMDPGNKDGEGPPLVMPVGVKTEK